MKQLSTLRQQLNAYFILGCMVWIGSTQWLSGQITFDIPGGDVGVVSNPISGSGGLIKQGSGTLVLLGQNTYTGGTTLTDGTLTLNTDASLGEANGNLTFQSGTLSLYDGFTTAREIILINLPGFGRRFSNPSTSNTSTLNGTISGTAGFDLNGGTLVLGGVSTFGGDADIDFGTLRLAGDDRLPTDVRINVLGFLSTEARFDLNDFDQRVGWIDVRADQTLDLGSGTLTVDIQDADHGASFSGSIIGSGSIVITGSRNPTDVTFGGITATRSYTGGTTISEARVRLVNSANQLGTSGTVTLENGAVLTMDIPSQTVESLDVSSDSLLSLTSGTLFVTTPDEEVSLIEGVIEGAGSVAHDGLGDLRLTNANSFSGGLTVNGGGRVILGNDTGAGTGTIILADGTLVSVGGITVANNLTLQADGTIQVLSGAATHSGDIGESGGARALEIVGPGSLTLSGTNTYSGGTTISGGTVSVQSDTNLGDSAGGLTISDATLRATGSMTTSRNVTLGSGAATLEVVGSENLVVDSVIGGSGSLNKTGTGTLTVGDSATYTGGTNILGGTLTLAGPDGSLPTGQRVVVNNNAILNLNGQNQAIAELDVFTGSQLMLGAGTLTVSPGSGIISGIDGVVSGSGGITQSGAGEMHLNASNTFSGGLLVDGGGAIEFGDSNAPGSGIITIENGRLDYDNGIDIDNTISLTGNGGIQVASGTATQSGAINENGGSYSLNKSGGGTLVFSGSSSHTGGTTVSGGTLRLAGGNNQLNTGAPVSIADTATLDLNDNNQTFSEIDGASGSFIDLGSGVLTIDTALLESNTIDSHISGSGSLARTGQGSLILSGDNAFSGGITASSGEGRLYLTHSNAAGTGTITNSAGAIYLGDGVNLGNTLDMQANTVVTVESGSATLSGDIRDTGDAHTLILSGDLTLTGTKTYHGGTLIASGTTSVSSDANFGDSSGSITNWAVLRATADFTSNRAITDSSVEGGFDVIENVTLTLGGVLSGSSRINKTGLGTLVLAGTSNTFSNGFNLVEGTLRLGADQALVEGSPTRQLSLASGTIFDLAGYNQTLIALEANSGSSITLGSGRLTLSPESGDTVTIASAISGSGGITAAGDGQVHLEGDNTFTGGLTLAGSDTVYLHTDNAAGSGSIRFSSGGSELGVVDGTTIANAVELQSHGVFTIASGSVELSGDIGGGGGLTLTGDGDFTLSGTNTFTGGTTFSGGTLSVAADANLGASSSGLSLDGNTLRATDSFTSTHDITLNGNATIAVDSGASLTQSATIAGSQGLTAAGDGVLVLGGTNTYSGGTTITGGTLSIATNANLGDAAGNITFQGDSSLATTSSFATSRTINLNTDGQLQPAAGTTLSLNGMVTGAGGLHLQGPGNLVLSGSNDYTGGTTIADGTLSIATNANLGANSGGVTFQGGELATTDTIFSDRTFTFESDALIRVAAGHTLDLSGKLTGAGGFNMEGPGEITLRNNSNDFSGGVSITDSTLSISADSQLGDSVNDVVLSGGQLTAADTLTSNRDITLESSGGSFDVSSGRTFTSSGTIDGDGQLTKIGSGTMILAGANTFSGGVAIDSGTLQLGVANALPSTAKVTAFHGATLNLDGNDQSLRELDVYSTANVQLGSGDLTLSNDQGVSGIDGVISGDGALIFTGNGQLHLHNHNTFAGGLVATDGTILLNHDMAAGTGTITATGADFEISNGVDIGNAIQLEHHTTDIRINSGTVTLSGDISADGGQDIFKAGNGTLVLSGNNTYRGTTFVTSGTLRILNSASLASNSSMTFGSAELDLADGVTIDAQNYMSGTPTFNVDSGTATYAGDLVGQSGFQGLTKTGSGTLVLSGNNTLPETTSVTTGTLQVDGTLDGSVMVSDGATLNGSGTMDGALTIANGGTLAPGNSPGTLTIADLNLNNGSILEFELATPGIVGSGINDLIVVNGDLTLDGILNVTALTGFDVGTYELINYTGSLLANNGLELGIMPGGFHYALSTGSPHSIDLVVSTVPEPNTVVLLAASCALWLTMTRRRSRTR